MKEKIEQALISHMPPPFLDSVSIHMMNGSVYALNTCMTLYTN